VEETFRLNDRLATGAVNIGKHGVCRVLLKDNQHFLWLLLVPEVSSEVTELHHLDDETYSSVCHSIKKFSSWVGTRVGIEKVNVAAIGNQVSQLHIHIVGRHSGDIAWPGVVWSSKEKQPYPQRDLITLQETLERFLASK
jgi:diadenosine tetraphosphate (Ap4A) HIT family hydrolase